MQPSTTTATSSSAPTAANGLLPSPMLEGFESFSSVAESASARRQRISMACQYCRHRKIRCCGGAPCRNCTRSGRKCEYTPVPEEVNRATREKKAMSKLTIKATPSPATPSNPIFAMNALPISPMPTFSPYLLEVPTFDMPYIAPCPAVTRPPHLGHRRTSSAPSYESAAWMQPPPAPMLNSPAQLESSAWMYNGWSAALPVPVPVIETTAPPPAPFTPSRAFPSVLEQTPIHAAFLASSSSPVPTQHHRMMSAPMPSVPTLPVTPPESRSGSNEPEYSYAPVSTPSTYLRPPLAHKGLRIQTKPNVQSYPYISPPVSPNTYYTPYATPSLYSSSSSQPTLYTPSPPSYDVSPTLAPEMPEMPSKVPEAMVGLGIGMGMGLGVPAIEHDVFYTPVLGSDEYFPGY